MPEFKNPKDALSHHVTGAIERGEKTPIVEQPAALEVPARESLLPWQQQGLQQTASGYGGRLTSPYMVQVAGRWRRVYCCIYSNAGTHYIGPSIKAGRVVDLWRDSADNLRAELRPKRSAP